LNLEPERVLTVIEVYTNLAVPDEDRYDFYDYLSNEGIITDIWFVIDRDADRVLSLAQNMAKMAIERFNHENSMDNFLKQLSSGSGLGQELTEMLEKAKQQEDTVSQRVSAVLDSKPKGNLINFSKRKK
jgi:aminopeptidase N